MTRSHLDNLKAMASNPNLQSVLPLIGSVLYLADKVEQLQKDKLDRPSVHDEEVSDQKVSRPSLQKMAMDTIGAAGEDNALRTRIYKALRDLQ
jgi:hypothetical protein